MGMFYIEIVKLLYYDDDGYVLQWWKVWILFNLMVCFYVIVQDCVDWQVFGLDIDIVVSVFDEMIMCLLLGQIIDWM